MTLRHKRAPDPFFAPEITKRVPDGISEMLDLICSGLIADPDDEVYSNISVPLNV